MTGRTADVGPDGKFAFADVAPGEWQLRFHAPRIAYVYEVEGGGTGENPTRIVVTANGTATALFPVIRGELNEMEIEIYVGDNFFYEVPFGSEGGTATVKVGTTVCWYNVGVRVHNVTGGPWVTSGDLQKTGAFIWTADRPGTFPYRCTHHEPQMTATLVVTA